MPNCPLLVMRIGTKSGFRAFVSSDPAFSSLMEREISHSFALWVTAIVSLSGSTQFSRGSRSPGRIQIKRDCEQAERTRRCKSLQEVACSTSDTRTPPRGHRLPLRKGNLHRVSTLSDQYMVRRPVLARIEKLRPVARTFRSLTHTHPVVVRLVMLPLAQLFYVADSGKCLNAWDSFF
jgi:hypothetical protein